MSHSRFSISTLPLLACVVFLPFNRTSGELIHRYQFSENGGTAVQDSVGTANGVIRGNGSSWSAGELSLPGGSSASAAYVDLPNGLISGLTDLTFEMWVSVDGSQNWSRIFDFGSSNFAEVPGPGGGGEGRDYFFLGATRGTNTNQQRVEIRNEDPGGGGITTIDANLATSLGTEYHHVVTYDADGSGGQALVKYYRDGVLVAQGNSPTQLSELNDVNNWLGRSNWTGDNNLQGTFNEFRIYDHALEQADVDASMAAGPDTLAGSAPSIDSFTVSSNSIYEGDTVTLAWSISGITGALDVSISPAPGDIAGDPANGNVQVSPLTTTTYTLTASDSSGSRDAEVTVVVDPGVPVANDLAVSTSKGVAVAVPLSASDPNGGTLAYSIVNPPGSGSLSGTAPNLTYTPNSGFAGSDSFTFKVNDGTYDSNVAVVSIMVNEPPVAPSDLLLDATSIPSFAVDGTFITRLRNVDANDQDSHAYALVSGAGDADNGLFRVSANQLLAAGDFAAQVGNSFNIRLRVTDNTGRSFEKAFVLTVVAASESVLINEIHYDPLDDTEKGEFIELFNPGDQAVDLSSWSIEGGVDYTFPGGSSIGSGEYLVIAQDPATLLAKYGVTALGPWTGRLSGDGEKVTLNDGSGIQVDEVDYGVGFPWPIASSGDGGSMELLNPSLDNDLGSSWRVSSPPGFLPEATLLSYASSTWSWRAGDSEASSPIEDWRLGAFVEDGTWSPNSQSPIGYGSVTGLTMNTVISDMRNNYNCFFARNTFTVAPGEMPTSLLINSSSDDGILVWINGSLVQQERFTGSPVITDFGSNQGSEGSVDTVTIENPAGFLVEGVNTIAVQVFNATVSSSDVGFDLEIIRPASADQTPQPTPGAVNSIFTTDVPPNIRQVNHSPNEPGSADDVLITAKVTDQQGVASVLLKYQVVAPGQFIPSRTPRTVSEIMAAPEEDPPLNPAFEDPANWTDAPMVDDGTNGDVLAGDGIYSAVIPAQTHRTLVRYRIEVEDVDGVSVRVPYADDNSLNFAYFVYNGVPDYVASTQSVHENGAGHVWLSELLETLPIYHWLIRPQDMASLQAYNGSQQFTNNGSATELAARRAWDWEGALVYDGKVYDHVRSRLRGGNSRYGDFDGRFPNGKRHYKFRFNRGYYFEAKDEKGRPYEEPWRIFNVSRMFGTKGGNSWGLPEEIGDTLYHTMGVPTQRAHWFHFRVIDGADEAPDQYNGDFWGIQQVQERYDVRFLESRDMPKGNLYKLSDFFFDAESQRRYQALEMVDDGSEFDNIRFNLHGGQNAAWLNQYVNYNKWYGYSAVGEAIRHYDIFPEPSGRHRLKNLVWYFEPTGVDPTRGVCWELPYDYDASWGPSFNNGWDHANNGLYGHVTVSGAYIDKPEMKIAHRNVLRSFRDLVWRPDQVGDLLDDRAAFISEMTRADQDRWRNAPLSAGTANDDTLEFKVQDMKNFAFNGWSGGSGPVVGAGGRGAFLDSIADGPDAGQLPATPTITYIGAPAFSTDGLQFESSAFADPQGSGTFGAIEWRIGEVEDPSAPSWDPEDDFILENDLIWGSGLLGTFNATVGIPPTALRVGHTYRARVRHLDQTGRLSHWSDPVEFTTTEPTILADLQSNLMITEVMYHPGAPSAAETTAGFVESDFEYLELQNISDSLILDLSDVRFTKGVDFDFSSGSVLSLAPGAYVVVVKNIAAFEMRYGTGLPVAGEWEATQNLSNGGEQLKLSHGAGTAIHDFVYDDKAPWPEAPDGDGVSMELISPSSAPDHSLAASWRGSLSPGGSPGGESAASPFALWMAGNGFTDPLGDPDGDGIVNLMVYAMGGDLLSRPIDASPVLSIISHEGEDHAAIEYRRRISATDVGYQVELSGDLENWSATAIEHSVTDNGDGTETVIVRSPIPVSGETRQFLRVRVSLN